MATGLVLETGPLVVMIPDLHECWAAAISVSHSPEKNAEVGGREAYVAEAHISFFRTSLQQIDLGNIAEIL